MEHAERARRRELVCAGAQDQRTGGVCEAVRTPESERLVQDDLKRLARVLGKAIAEYQHGLVAKHSKGPQDVGEFDLVDAVNRALERGTVRTANELRRGLGALATIGSTAPFVGLFGTVWGIIKAFQKMAIEGGGGLGTVSGAIAEALINTAFGLLVAIPAVMFFNNLTNRVEEMQVDITDSATELVDFFMKEGR